MSKRMIELGLRRNGADRVIFRKNGEIRAIMGYFYKDKEKFGKLMNYINGIVGSRIVDKGDHWHEFVGGAKVGTKESSYQWITFVLEE